MSNNSMEQTENDIQRISLLKDIFAYWNPEVKPIGDRSSIFSVVLTKKIEYMRVDRMIHQLKNCGLLLYGIATKSDGKLYFDIVENEFN